MLRVLRLAGMMGGKTEQRKFSQPQGANGTGEIIGVASLPERPIFFVLPNFSV